MKVIKSFNLDTKDIREAGETRTLAISGDKGAVFTLEIKSGANYYNFQTNLFQATKTNLSNISLTGGTYNTNIQFPSVTAGAQYDVYLTTGVDTKHAEYKQVRFLDGSVDINSSTGSNSNLIQKVIYQTLDVTITINGYSPNGTVTGANTTPATIETSRDKSTSKIPFTCVFTVTSTRTLSVNKQPVSSDMMAFVTATVGNPVDIPGEDIYPTRVGSDTVDGALEAVTKAVMDTAVASTMNVGDRVEGGDIPSASVVTVVALNPDGDNVKEFSVSEAINADDGATLTFAPRRNYRWEMLSTSVDLSKITNGMRQPASTFFASQATVKDYVDSVTIFENERNEEKIEKLRIPGVDTRSIQPLIVRDGTTKVVTTTTGSSTNPIYLTFDQQALLTFSEGANAKLFSYGTSEINRLTGYDVEFSDLAVALTEVSTTTTAAVSASTSVPVTQRAGIMDGISTVSGIGIDPSVANPTVSSGAGSVIGAGTLVLSAAQTLEDGITLTFPGAGTIATVTGNIKINNVGNEDVTLRFDLEKFLTMH